MARPQLLIVDDDAYTRYALRSIFHQRHWDVLLASSVTEGLGLLDLGPRALILDLNLPDGGGEVLLGVVRERRMRTRVAVCSATTESARIAAVQRLRPEAFLHKPIDLGPIFQLFEAPWSASA